jgi:glucokinase
MGKYASIGIDIGGTKTFCILVDQNLKVLAREKFKTAPAEGKVKFSKRLVERIKHLAAEGKKRGVEIVGVGIASAGQVNPDEVVIDDSPNIVWLESFRIGQLFKKKLGLDSVIGNDVHLALYAEHEFGAAAGHDHVLGVFFGTGAGVAAAPGD